MENEVLEVLRKWKITEKGIKVLNDEGITDFFILKLIRAKDLESKLTIRDRIYFEKGHAELYPELYSHQKSSSQESTSKQCFTRDSTPNDSSPLPQSFTDDDNTSVTDSSSAKFPALPPAGIKRQRKKKPACSHSVDFLESVVSQYQEGRLVLAKLASYKAQAEEEGQSLQALLTLALDRSDYRSIAHCVVSYLAEKAQKENPDLDRYPNINYNTFKEFAVPCATLFGNSESSWFDVEAGQASAKSYATSSVSPRPGKKSNKTTQANGYLWYKYKHEVFKYNKTHREQLDQRKARKRLVTIENRETAAQKKSKREREHSENPGKPTRGRPAVVLKSADELKNEAEGLWNSMLEDQFVKYLRSSFADFTKISPEIVAAFNSSHQVRCAYIHHESADFTKYLSIFPFYSSPQAGPKLINEDFLAKYPYPEPPLAIRAGNDALNIFAIVRKNCSNTLPEPFNSIPNVGEIGDPYRAEHCLLALIHAEGGTCYAKTPKGTSPVSKVDAARTVIAFVQSAEQVKQHHNKVCEQNHGTVQPYIIAIGSPTDIGNVRGIEVRLLDLSLPCESIVKAYELCFQCFYVFNLEYPLPAHNIWTFIQARYFDISLSANQKVRRTTQNLLLKLQLLDSKAGGSSLPPSSSISLLGNSHISETEICALERADTEPVNEEAVENAIAKTPEEGNTVENAIAKIPEEGNTQSSPSTGFLTTELDTWLELELHESLPSVVPPKRKGVRTRGGKN